MLLTGGTANYEIWRVNPNTTAFYIGDFSDRFRAITPNYFTPGENLFRLDGISPVLSESYNATTPFAGEVTATLPAGLNITHITIDSATATLTASGNVITFSGTFNEPSITLAIEGTLANGRIPVSFSTTAFGVNVDTPASPGAAVQTPATANHITHNSITVNAAVLVPTTGQTIEYSISESDTIPPTSGWQTGLTFTNLTPETEYFVWARSAESSTHYTGEPMVSAAIRTPLRTPHTGIANITAAMWAMFAFIAASAVLWGFVLRNKHRNANNA